MKKLFTMLLLIVLSTICFGKKVLYVGTSAEYKPYEYLENNKIIGFDVELMQAILSEIDYDIEWKNITFNGLLPALQMSKIDAVIAGMSATEERKKSIDFSKPYLNFKVLHSIIVHENEKNILNKDGLKDKNIGIQLGTIQEEIAKSLGGKVIFYDTFTNALFALKQKKIDAVIMDEAPAKKYLENIDGVKICDTVVDKDPGSAIAVKKGNLELIKKLEEGFEKVKKSGKYRELVYKYFPDKVEEIKF